MQAKIIRYFRNLAVLILVSQVYSCTVAYNSIHYTKSEGYVISKTQTNSEKEKFKENKVFIHYKDSIFQLASMNINPAMNGQEKSVSGKVTSVNSNYVKAYEELKRAPKNKDKNLFKIAGPQGYYIKQTHIFADSINLSNGNIKVTESHIHEVTSYFRSKAIRYILIAGILGVLALIGATIVLERNLW